jgi:hypothetical protein
MERSDVPDVSERSLKFLRLKEGKAWPTSRGTYRKPESSILKDYTDEGESIDWTKLAKFFDNRLKLNNKLLDATGIAELNSVELSEKYDVDFGDSRHVGNVTTYSQRYGLPTNVPYLMRVKGFGFVETPTIQVGQLLDTLSDYQMCAEHSAIDIKAKYNRRLQRLEHSWNVHNALKEGLTPQEVKVCPFVLSEDVAELLKNWIVSPDWSSFFEATKPESVCYEMNVNKDDKTVTSGKENDCATKSARMNCTKMMPHAFNGKKPSDLYSNKAGWVVQEGRKREHSLS